MLANRRSIHVPNPGPQYSRPLLQDAEESLEMKSGYKNLLTACCCAVLTFGLAACGGSSDSDDAMVTAPPSPVTSGTSGAGNSGSGT